MNDESPPGWEAPEITASIFTFFWPGLTQPFYRQAAGDFAAFCFADAVRRSRQMDWVPRPPGSRPVAWILLQAVQIAWRKITRSSQVYVSVRNVVANNQRPNYDMLVNGLDPNY